MKLLVKILALVAITGIILAQTMNRSTEIELTDAPSFVLNDLDGNEISMDDFNGQYVVIHIATTWCPYCNAEAPYLQKIYEDYADQEVMVLIIDVKEGKDLVDPLLRQKYNLTFPILLDADGKVAAKFAPEDVLPELARDEIMLASNILVDPQGKIQFMSLLDTRNFDSKLINLRAKLDALIEAENTTAASQE